MEALKKLTPSKRRDIDRFMRAHNHVLTPGSVGEMKWTAEAMELLGDTNLKNSEKRALVIALHGQLAQSETNGFKGDFDIVGAIQFVWDTNNQRYGVKLRRKGMLEKCLPCCSDVSVVYDGDKNTVEVDATPLPSNENQVYSDRIQSLPDAELIPPITGPIVDDRDGVDQTIQVGGTNNIVNITVEKKE